MQRRKLNRFQIDFKNDLSTTIIILTFPLFSTKQFKNSCYNKSAVIFELSQMYHPPISLQQNMTPKKKKN